MYRYSEQSKSKAIGITIEPRQIFAQTHLSQIFVWVYRLESEYNLYTRTWHEILSWTYVRAVSESFQLAKDDGFKVLLHDADLRMLASSAI